MGTGKRKITIDRHVILGTAKRIQRQRKLRGLTQAELAALIDIEPATLSRLETGKRPVSTAILQKLSDHLGVPVSELLGEKVPRTSTDEERLIAAWRLLDPEARQIILFTALRLANLKA